MNQPQPSSPNRRVYRDTFASLSGETVQTLLLLTTGLCNTIVAVWLAIHPPATSYEGSIYTAYPTTLWIVFLIGMGTAMLLILGSILVGDRNWIYGLLFICSLYVLFHLLPVFRGWAMYGRGGADALTHIGVGKSILETGSIPAEDWYPVVHVLIAGLGGFGVRMGAITSLLSAFFIPLYIVSMFVFGQRLLGTRKAGLAVLVCSVPLVYGEFSHSLHPAIFSFLLLPVFFAVFIGGYNSDRMRPYALLLAVLGSTLLLFHPITTVYAVGMLCVSLVVRAGYSWFTDLELRYSGEAAIVTGLTAGWFAWYLQFSQIQEFARRVIDAGAGSGAAGDGAASGGGGTGGGATESIAAEMIAKVQGIDSVGKIVTGFIGMYGPQFVISLLAIGAIFSMVGWYWSTKRYPIENTWLTAQFGAGMAISLFGIVFYVISTDLIRNSRYLFLFGTLLAGLLLYRSLTGQLPWPSLNGTAVQVVLVVLLLSTAGLAAMTSYNHNYHLTYAEQEGTDWYYEHRADEPVGAATDVEYKMREYSQGGDYGSAKLRQFGSDIATVDKRFGYATHDSVATTVDGYETYIVTKPYDTVLLEYLDPSVRSKHMTYYEEDLQRLGTDQGADRVYANGGYTIWYVDPEE